MNKFAAIKEFIKRRPKSSVFFGLVVLNLILYANVIGGFFVSDDFDWLNSVGNGMTVLKSFAGNYYGEHGVGGTFRPMVAVFFYLGRLIFGLNPIGFHVVQILLHAGVAYLVYLIALKLFESNKRASLIAIGSALVFSIMPSHVEAVGWVAAVGDPLATLFYLGSFYFYILWRTKNPELRTKYLILSLIFFVFSALTKEIAITLPFVILFYELLVQKQYSAKKLLTKLSSYILVLSLYLIYRFWAIGILFGYYRRSSLTEVLHLDQYARTLVNLMASMVAAGQTRIDLGNAMVHFWYLSVAVLVFLFSSFYVFLKNNRKVLIFLVTFWIINIALILPLSLGILNDEGQRYAYLPSIAFCLLIAWIFAELYDRYKLKIILAPILLAAFWILLQHMLVNQWAIAGTISKKIYDQLPTFDFQTVEKTYVVGLPDSYLNAQLYRNGFIQSLALQDVIFDPARVIRVPAYVRLNDLNRSSELYGQRVEKPDGFLWQTRDLQPIVTGNATESYPGYHFELWDYNYANATAKNIRMYFDDPKWKENAQVIYFDEGILNSFKF